MTSITMYCDPRFRIGCQTSQRPQMCSSHHRFLHLHRRRSSVGLAQSRYDHFLLLPLGLELMLAQDGKVNNQEEQNKQKYCLFHYLAIGPLFEKMADEVALSTIITRL